MHAESSTNDPEAEGIRHQMAETSHHLGEQVEALEHGVMDLVHDATTAASDTIASVKESVESTVHSVQDAVKGTMTSVKHAFDIPGHVRHHPWIMLGGAVALGYFCGRFFRPRR